MEIFLSKFWSYKLQIFSKSYASFEFSICDDIIIGGNWTPTHKDLAHYNIKPNLQKRFFLSCMFVMKNKP
jgi:hypothetical protein